MIQWPIACRAFLHVNWFRLREGNPCFSHTCLSTPHSFRASKEVLLNPLIISRNEKERVLIESSINSLRVSIAIKQADDIERILVHKFTRFLTQRAENFVILRRKPIEVKRDNNRRQQLGLHGVPFPPSWTTIVLLTTLDMPSWFL